MKNTVGPSMPRRPAPGAVEYGGYAVQGLYEPLITVPLGMRGELRFCAKHGGDSFRFLCTDIYSGRVRRIGDGARDSAAGGGAVHLLQPGVWSFSARNETKGRFEKIITRFFPTDRGGGTFLLGATTRISAQEKTCIVYEVRIAPAAKGGLLAMLGASCPFDGLGNAASTGGRCADPAPWSAGGGG